ncbi:MAG: VTT domain-containing protein [Candidatus Nanopelagicales bacterium]
MVRRYAVINDTVVAAVARGTVVCMTQSLALLDFLNPENILNWLGPLALIGVIFIIFAECGLLVGFFLPGDSLLFITGLFIAQGFIDTPIGVAATLLALAAVIGNATGYWIGYKAGPKLFSRPDSRFFRKEYVDKTHQFFERYGARAVVLARFVPIVRTFITAMAGVGRMNFRTYIVYSTIGGILWGAGVTVLGYLLGNVPFVKDHIELILIGVVGVSVLPIVFEYWRHKREAAALADQSVPDAN